MAISVTEKLKIHLSLPTSDNDFQVEQASAAEHAARKLGIDLAITYAENDTVNQSTQILKALQRSRDARPDGIVIEPVGGDALPRAARAARDAGVGWAVLNRAPSYISELRRGAAAPVFMISSNN